MPERSILLVEDEPDIAGLISLHLHGDGVRVHHASDGATGLALALDEPWDLLLLDGCLPGCDGLAICEAARRQSATVSIIMVTARGSEADRVRGLDGGADDYLTKPFSVAELVARVKATFRKLEALEAGVAHGTEADRIVIGDIELFPAAHEVHVAGRPVALTPKEYDLLLTFARAPLRVFARKELLSEVWGHTHDGYLPTVNTHVNRLRAKIEPDPSAPRYITTVWGVGYKLSVPGGCADRCTSASRWRSWRSCSR